MATTTAISTEFVVEVTAVKSFHLLFASVSIKMKEVIKLVKNCFVLLVIGLILLYLFSY